jgi:amino acid transporter
MMDIRKTWNRFAANGVIIFAVAGTFMIDPPQLSVDGDIRIEWLVKFLIAALSALLAVPLLRRSKRSNGPFWRRFAVGAIIFGMLITGGYIYLVLNWSVPYYQGKRLVTGHTMTKEGEYGKRKLAVELNRPMIDNETLVKARRGETQYIWPQNELQSRFFLMCVLYILSFLLVTVFIISIIQAIYCYERND